MALVATFFYARRRIWELRAPSYVLRDAPVAFRTSMKIGTPGTRWRNLDLHVLAPPFDPRLYFAFPLAFMTSTTRIGDILGRGEQAPH